ncbi:cupin domain-containing protein [Sphingobacterium wenxiniae]|uniref:Cupin domain-containing protein n=1 Tax=Sphingobacterium wenxiniae TaxID=683125 RepID=A0A1I6QJF7_9SPHI|nr:cupin domain-containing protein [Sphingobacterium wenxiniae]SFS52460.1 Cupin domain-containing protein [Sphingobacterium wenxiniae]
MKNIVKKENAVSRQFLGVDFVVLSIGKDTMVTKMLYKTTDNVPFHNHPNEQSGYIISGQYRLKFGGSEYLLSEGDTYSIPADVSHSIEIIEAGEVVDVFSPIRQDYL